MKRPCNYILAFFLLMDKSPSKLGYISKIAENVITVQMTNPAQKTQVQDLFGSLL